MRYKTTITFREDLGLSNQVITIESEHGVRWTKEGAIYFNHDETTTVYPLATILSIVEEDSEYEESRRKRAELLRGIDYPP